MLRSALNWREYNPEGSMKGPSRMSDVINEEKEGKGRVASYPPFTVVPEG